MTAPVLQAVVFRPPLTNPAPTGLNAVVQWTDDTVPRWFDDGVQFWPVGNYGFLESGGLWAGPWCAEPGSGSGADQVKQIGTVPELIDPFPAFTLYSSQSCDPSPGSRTETENRLLQMLRIGESVGLETMLGGAMVAEVTAEGIAVSRDTVREAVAYLEGQLAKTNTLGQIHASPEAAALEYGIVLPSGAGVLRTPLGHQWVFGGGYVDTLGDLLVATSPVFGWRTPMQVHSVVDFMDNAHVAIAERSYVLGAEKLVAAVYVQDIGGGS